MNEPMNEYGLAKKIVRHLDQGTANLDSTLKDRLQMARKHALDLYVQPNHNFSLAWAGHGAKGSHKGTHPSARAWVTLAVLVLGIMFFTYWQATQDLNDVSEIDVHLLAHDLPINAFIDTGFDTWLEGSSPE